MIKAGCDMVSGLLTFHSHSDQPEATISPTDIQSEKLIHAMS